MNTNETIEYEIPTEEELDVSVQGAERRGICIGIEFVLSELNKRGIEVVGIRQAVNRRLVKQEGKGMNEKLPMDTEKSDPKLQPMYKVGYRAGVEKFQDWSDVAFYPGPNENPDFQAGFMEAIHEVGRIAYRLLAEQGKKE